jgi:hypothetical protein
VTTEQQGKTMLKLSAKGANVAITLNPAVVAEVIVPDGAGPQPFQVRLDDGTVLTGKFNPKSLRKAAKLCREDPVNMFVTLKGRLGNNNQILDCGIAAQPKAPKPVAEPVREAAE